MKDLQRGDFQRVEPGESDKGGARCVEKNPFGGRETDCNCGLEEWEGLQQQEAKQVQEKLAQDKTESVPAA